MPLAFLYETTRLDSDGVTHPVLLTNGAGYNHPTAPGFYEPRLQGATDASNGIFVQRSMFDNGKLGAGSATFGAVTPVNSDGGVSAYLNCSFGQTAFLKLGDDTGPYSDFQPVLTAKAGQATAADTTVSIGWASRLTELDQPACPATFAGTNSGTTGLEGRSTDIGGSNKPWAIGKLTNIPPVQLNSALRIFGWNFDTDGSRLPSTSVDAVKFEGAPWMLDMADFASSAAMITWLEANSLTQGYYVTCLAESLVAMGGSNTLNGDVTFDVTVGSDRLAGSLWKAVLVRAGVDPADISGDDLAALNTAAPYEAGYYATGSMTFAQIADALAASVAACYLPDRFNIYRIRQMTPPAGPPVAGFKRLELGVVQGATDGDLVNVSLVSSGSDWTPIKTVRCTYGHNWQVLSSSAVAAAVSADNAAFLTSEWRYTDPLTDSAVAAMYPNAGSQDFTTYLVNKADAAAIAVILGTLYGAQRREYQATVTYGAAFAALLDLGATVAVTHAKYGWSATLASIHGIRLRGNAGLADVKLWL